jgi:endonuclease YncB( thermonuclease family)
MKVTLLWLSALFVFVVVYIDARKYPADRRNPNSTVASFYSVFGDMFRLFTGSKVFENANDIPSDYFKENREIKGIVVKVTDGDTVRVRHVTGSQTTAQVDGNLKDHTIAVRFAAVDAPETAKFGETGQELGEVAKNFVTERLLGKRVTIKLLSRDQ